jgi:hypothetical protein
MTMLQALAAPANLSNEEMECWDTIVSRVVTLNERLWENRLTGVSVKHWLENFTGLTGSSAEEERLHALYVLSQFMYYGAREIRLLLRAVYRELFLLPLAQQINARVANVQQFKAELTTQISSTRFLGVGNPSESGVHLLYYFRQENRLPKSSFLDAAQLYRSDSTAASGRRPAEPGINRYVFLDDLCGSGETAETYSKNLLPDLINAQPNVELHYLALFGTKDGLDHVRDRTAFGKHCSAIYELDKTYKWLDTGSRYFSVLRSELNPSVLQLLPQHYGKLLWPEHAMGWSDGQLLLGFFHNTPDNTLPIIWCDEENGSDHDWYPVFHRYPKIK